MVWRAEDHNLGQAVALKFFRPGFPPGLVFREAQVHTALAGPHILRVLNADIYNDIAYIATEIAEEGSAMDRVFGSLGVMADTAIRWARQLLSGLDACHRAGLLHRDVKPGNLLLRTNDLAQLGDFGMIERLNAGVTPAHGTVAFHPPETLTTNTMTVQSDVYAAGVTLWMLLTGRHPFIEQDTDPADWPALIANGIPRLRDLAPHVPARLALVVETAAAVTQADRFLTANEMDQALGQLPRFGRIWQESQPAPGDHRAWESTVKPSEQHGYRVVVRQSPGSGFDIETRRSGGAQHLVHACTFDRVTAGQLPVRLRAVFNNLS